MDYSIEAGPLLVASGMVNLPPVGQADGFIPRVSAATASFALLQKEYARAFASDSRIAGPERIALVRHCDDILKSLVGALFLGLSASCPEGGDPERSLSIAEREKDFKVSRSGLSFQLSLRLRARAEASIKEMIKTSCEGPLRLLLETMREGAADGQLSGEEKRELLPLTLDLALSIMAIRRHIESCGSSA